MHPYRSRRVAAPTRPVPLLTHGRIRIARSEHQLKTPLCREAAPPAGSMPGHNRGFPNRQSIGADARHVFCRAILQTEPTCLNLSFQREEFHVNERFPVGHAAAAMTDGSQMTASSGRRLRCPSLNLDQGMSIINCFDVRERIAWAGPHHRDREIWRELPCPSSGHRLQPVHPTVDYQVRSLRHLPPEVSSSLPWQS